MYHKQTVSGFQKCSILPFRRTVLSGIYAYMYEILKLSTPTEIEWLYFIQNFTLILKLNTVMYISTQQVFQMQEIQNYAYTLNFRDRKTNVTNSQ